MAQVICTSMQPSPLKSCGSPFLVDCARCGATKSSTDVSVFDTIPRKFFCGHCTICTALDLQADNHEVDFQ